MGSHRGRMHATNVGCKPNSSRLNKPQQHHNSMAADAHHNGQIQRFSCIIATSFVAFILYLNTLNADFAYDDSRAIKSNDDLLPSVPLINIFYNDFWGTPLKHSGSHKSYRPLCVLSFRINYALGEMNPWGYHLVNVLLHTIVTGLFTYFANMLFTKMFPTVVAGLLFGIHPIHTEAVAGVVGRADVGACLFFLISFISYVHYCKYRDDLQNRHRRWIHLLGSMVFATCSMLTKEHGITVLGVCATYDCFVKTKLRTKDITYILQEKKYRNLLEGILSIASGLFILVSLRIYFMGSKPPEFAPADNPAADNENFWTRTLTFLYLPAFNFWLLLFPQILSFDWSMESVPLISSFRDFRNVFTLAFYFGMFYINLFAMDSLSKNRDRSVSDPGNSPSCYDNAKSNSHGSYYLNGNHNNKCPTNYQSFPKVKKNSSGFSNGFMFCQNNNVCTNYQMNGQSRLMNGCHQSSVYENGNSIHASPSCGPLSSYTSSTTVSYVSSSDFKRNIDIIIISMALLVFPFIPATNLFFYVGFVIAERVLYIPSMGVCLLVALGANNIYRTIHDDRKIYRLFIILISIIFIAMCVRTIRRNNDWKSEEDLYRSGIPVNPPKAYGNLANILSSQDRKEEAEWAYRKALSYRSNMADVHYNLGILMQEQKRNEEALQSYKYSIQFRPRMAMAHLNLGLVLGLLGRKEEAIEVYKHCAQIDGSGLKDPKTHESAKISALFNLGRLYADDGKYEDAIEVYKEAVSKMPAHYQPQSLFNMLGEAYYKLEKYSDAEMWYKEALRAKPDHIPAHLTYGKLLSKRNRLREAEKLFSRAKQLAPNDSSVYQHFGQFLSESQRHHEAAELFLEAAELAPDEYEIVFNTANTLRQAGRNHEAEQFYHQAVRLRPQEATSHMNLGAMLHVNGKLLEAEASYLEALRLKPEDVITQNNLQKLRNLLVRKGIRPSNYHPEARR